MTGPINAMLEQSFPPRNSIGKVGCCVLLLQSAVLVGSRPNPTFQAEMQAELQCRTLPQGRFNCAGQESIAQARNQLYKADSIA